MGREMEMVLSAPFRYRNQRVDQSTHEVAIPVSCKGNDWFEEEESNRPRKTCLERCLELLLLSCMNRDVSIGIVFFVQSSCLALENNVVTSLWERKVDERNVGEEDGDLDVVDVPPAEGGCLRIIRESRD